MNDKEFWDIIGWVNEQEVDFVLRSDELGEALGDLPAVEIEDFFLIYDRHVAAAWNADVWALAYLVNSYGDRSRSEDLYDFICWLIDRGRIAYQAALTDPESL